MNQELEHGGCIRRQGVTRNDVAGILMGAPILLIGLSLLAVNGANLVRGRLINPYDPWWVLYIPWGLTFLLISVALLVPGALYKRAMVRAAGFAAAALVIAVAALLAIEAGACAWAFFDPHEELRELSLIFGTMVLAVFGYAVGCTVVLVKKLQPGRKQTAATIAAGILLSALDIFLMVVVLS